MLTTTFKEKGSIDKNFALQLLTSLFVGASSEREEDTFENNFALVTGHSLAVHTLHKMTLLHQERSLFHFVGHTEGKGQFSSEQNSILMHCSLFSAQEREGEVHLKTMESN